MDNSNITTYSFTVEDDLISQSSASTCARPGFFKSNPFSRDYGDKGAKGLNKFNEQPVSSLQKKIIEKAQMDAFRQLNDQMYNPFQHKLNNGFIPKQSELYEQQKLRKIQAIHKKQEEQLNNNKNYTIVFSQNKPIQSLKIAANNVLNSDTCIGDYYKHKFGNKKLQKPLDEIKQQQKDDIQKKSNNFINKGVIERNKLNENSNRINRNIKNKNKIEQKDQNLGNKIVRSADGWKSEQTIMKKDEHQKIKTPNLVTNKSIRKSSDVSNNVNNGNKNNNDNNVLKLISQERENISNKQFNNSINNKNNITNNIIDNDSDMRNNNKNNNNNNNNLINNYHKNSPNITGNSNNINNNINNNKNINTNNIPKPISNNKNLVKKQLSTTTTKQIKNINTKQGKKKFADVYEGSDRNLVQQLENQMASSPNITFDDIAELDTAKNLLQEAVLLPRMMPDFFKGIRKAMKGILLFGPPGTGKTLLAKAVAANNMFFNVSASSLASKWKGESQKMVRLLFEMARYYAPCVIFFDEIDAIVSKRSENQHESARKVKTELLVQMDGVGSTDHQVFVLAATNRPWDLDQALRRRLEKRIYIPLPGKQGRKQMFTLNLKDLKLSANINWQKVVELTKGCSGADICNICRDAAYMPMRRRIQKVGGIQKLHEINQKDLLEQQITQQDMIESAKKIKPSVNSDDLQKYTYWMKQFGST